MRKFGMLPVSMAVHQIECRLRLKAGQAVVFVGPFEKRAHFQYDAKKLAHRLVEAAFQLEIKPAFVAEPLVGRAAKLSRVEPAHCAACRVLILTQTENR